MKPNNQVEEIESNAEKESDNLIQSGIVVDISSRKDQGLEHADKVCKYMLSRSFMNFDVTSIIQHSINLHFCSTFLNSS